MDKAIFIDKDGTLVKDVPYNINPGKIELYPEVPNALLDLKNSGYKLIVISNQSGVALGYFEEDELITSIEYLQELLKKKNIVLDGFYYCPHHPQGKAKNYSVDCFCRKPKPGLILQAAKELNIDISQSWMIGDILNDVEAGNLAGCATILIDNGNETEWIKNKTRTPTYIVNNLEEAAVKILKKNSAVEIPKL